MFITRVETQDGLLHVKVYSKGTPAKLIAWCACPDTEQGRAAIGVLVGVSSRLQMSPVILEARNQPAGR